MNNTTYDDAFSWDYSVRANFYLLPPADNYVRELKDVPPILIKAIPFMVVLTVLEWLILTLVGKAKNWHFHDVLVNFTTGSLSQAVNIFFLRGLELTAYLWVYKNVRLATLPWDSIYTYLAAIVGVDFCSYLWHRTCHEVSFIWSFHYLHHSSEYLNMSVGARVSFMMRVIKWVFYLPMATLGLPPAAFLVHSQLGFAWGFWSHNDVCPKASKIIPGIGHLIEFIFITPSHHRVHHGVNHYCIDKNYGQVLAIWDRMFGTFAEERDDEPITYGTVSQVNSNHIFDLQVRPTLELLQRVAETPSLGDKLRTVFYGPGWSPGKPRLGLLEDIPDERGRKRFEVVLPNWFTAYLAANCGLTFYTYLQGAFRLKNVSPLVQHVSLVIQLSSCIALGGLFDAHRYSVWLEPLRLVFFLLASLMLPIFGSTIDNVVVMAVCVGSLLLWPQVSSLTLARTTISPKTE